MATETPTTVATDLSPLESAWQHLVEAAQTMTTQWSLEDLGLQVLIVLLSVIAGWVIGHRVANVLRAKGLALKERTLMANGKRVLYFFGANISFSVASGTVLALGTYILVHVFQYPSESMVILRVAYSLFFSYALLCMCLGMLQGLVGTHIITRSVRRGFSMGFWVLAVLNIVGILPDLIAFLDSFVIPIGDGRLTLWTLMIALLTVALTLGVAHWLAHLVGELIDTVDNLSLNLKVVLKRVVSIAFMVIAVLMSLSSLGIDLTVLSVLGGAVGVGLGFGLQKIASNYISGFIILLDKSIKIGDLVTVGDFRGRVTQINTRYTVVRAFSGVENIVPNEYFVTSAVENHSYTEESTVANITIGVAYGSDIKRALEIMLEEANRERPRIDTSRRGWAYIDNFGDSSVNLTMGVWVRDPVMGTASLRTGISLEVMRRFAEEGIEIPFNQLDLNIRHVDAGVLPVQLVSEKPTEAPKA